MSDQTSPGFSEGAADGRDLTKKRSRRMRALPGKAESESLAAAFESLESRSMLAANALDVEQVMWNGKLVEAVRNEYVLRMPQLNAAVARSPIDYACKTPAVQASWSLESLGTGFYKVTAPGATQTAITAWAKSVGARYISANRVGAYEVVPNDPLYSNTANWAFPKIQADKAWDVGTGTKSTIVAVLDSGVDYNHPDLAGNMWRNPNEIINDGIDNDNNGYIDDIYGVNAAAGTADPMDKLGHGTFCAGLVGAVGNNAVGMTGTNWSAQIMAVAVGNTAPTVAGVIAGANYIVSQKLSGQNVAAVNCSFSVGYSQPLEDVFKLMGNAGMVVACAAGNYGDNNDVIPIYPANLSVPEIISVAASDSSDQLASFSNYGPTTVDLAAPGVSVLSTRLLGSSIGVPLAGNTSYGVSSGTSFAAPLVAGTAALLKSMKPAASAQQIKAAILDGVDKVPGLSGLVLTGGRLNMAKAVQLLNASAGSVPVASLKTGQGLKFLEGNTGYSFAEVKINLDRPCDPGRTAAVWYETLPGGSAFSGSDFVPQSGFVTFSAGETEKAIRIKLIGERLAELDEQFSIKFDAAKSKNVTLGSSLVTVTILDDDNTANPSQPGGTDPLLPIVSVAAKTQASTTAPGQSVPLPIREGGAATFVITLDRTSNKTVSVKYRTSQPVLVPANTALEGLDYVATSGTMTFLPGERSKEFTVGILSDRITDANESFRVVLTEPVNVNLAGQTGTVASAVTATITDVPYIPPPAPGFQITVMFPDSSLTTSQQAVFQQAANRWQEIIVGDLPNVIDPANGQTIDDILITATAPLVDGVGGILGQAGPTDYRPGTYGLPYKGVMEFDSADVANMVADASFKDVVLHEMGHVLGFGTLWATFGLLQGAGGAAPIYTGVNALREYRSLFAVPKATGVPVEGNASPPGSADAHWSETLFKTELMTPYTAPVGTRMPISRITVGQFQDLGYQVNYAKADSYARPAIMSVVPAADATKPKARMAVLSSPIGSAGGPPMVARQATNQRAEGVAPARAAVAVGKTFAALAAASSQAVAAVGGPASGRRVFAAIGRS